MRLFDDLPNFSSTTNETMRDYTYKHGTYELPNDLRPKNLRPKKINNTLVSGNGGDEKNLHSDGRKKNKKIINLIEFFK